MIKIIFAKLQKLFVCANRLHTPGSTFATKNLLRMIKIAAKMKKMKEQRFIDEVISRMNKLGYKCRFDDNHLVIGNNDCQYDVQIWAASDSGKRRVQFFRLFGLKDMDLVQPEGLIMLTSECNNHNDLTTTLFLEDHFACRADAFISSTKDFAEEFAFARKQIDETIHEFNINYKAIKEDFPIKQARRPIGFLAERYCAEENSDVCKLVAQSKCNFAK